MSNAKDYCRVIWNKHENFDENSNKKIKELFNLDILIDLKYIFLEDKYWEDKSITEFISFLISNKDKKLGGIGRCPTQKIR